MRKISASYVFPLKGEPLKNGIIVVSDSGEIIEIIDTKGELTEIQGLEYYTGILSPGFINAYCNLEYSYAKGLIEPGCGLISFIEQLSKKKSTDNIWIEKYAKQADRLMAQTGCIAVADTTSSAVVAEIKKQSKLYYYSLIECQTLHQKQSERLLDDTQSTEYKYNQTWFIATMPQKNRSNYPIYNQEEINTNIHFRTTDTATPSIIPLPIKEQQTLLINNTLPNKEYLETLQKNRSVENTFLITCPQSNLYIEKQLPNYSLWQESGFPIIIGTDSLASNSSLSIINELKTIQKHNKIGFHEILHWATINGAKALSIESWAGTLEAGKNPGINLITGIDLRTFELLPNASAKRLV